MTKQHKTKSCTLCLHSAYPPPTQTPDPRSTHLLLRGVAGHALASGGIANAVGALFVALLRTRALGVNAVRIRVWVALHTLVRCQVALGTRLRARGLALRLCLRAVGRALCALLALVCRQVAARKRGGLAAVLTRAHVVVLAVVGLECVERE